MGESAATEGLDVASTSMLPRSTLTSDLSLISVRNFCQNSAKRSVHLQASPAFCRNESSVGKSRQRTSHGLRHQGHPHLGGARQLNRFHLVAAAKITHLRWQLNRNRRRSSTCVVLPIRKEPNGHQVRRAVCRRKNWHGGCCSENPQTDAETATCMICCNRTAEQEPNSEGAASRSARTDVMPRPAQKCHATAPGLQTLHAPMIARPSLHVHRHTTIHLSPHHVCVMVLQGDTSSGSGDGGGGLGCAVLADAAERRLLPAQVR